MTEAKKPINPKLIPVVSAPHFIFGVFLTALNWRRLGFPEKARNTIRWGIIGTVLILIVAAYFPIEIIKKLWSVGIGINLGTGMALRTLQLPEYNKFLERIARNR